jgi:hypothetical protein
MSTFKIDFGAGFDVTESPADEFNIELDLSEVVSGGELGGNMDAPTVDATHAGSAHHAESHASRHEAGGADIMAASRLRSGTDASKPSSGNTEGDAYWATDTDKLYVWDGSAWKEIGAGGGGSVPAPWAIWVPENVFDIGNAGWPSANRALFIPFTVLTTITVTQIRIHVVTQSGNLDVGIYDDTLTRKVSSGSTAVGASGGQVVDITDTQLNAGRYYFAMVVDNTTANFARDISYSGVLGRWQYEDSAFPLPASITALDGFYNYAPVAVLHINGGIS